MLRYARTWSRVDPLHEVAHVCIDPNSVMTVNFDDAEAQSVWMHFSLQPRAAPDPMPHPDDLDTMHATFGRRFNVPDLSMDLRTTLVDAIRQDFASIDAERIRYLKEVTMGQAKREKNKKREAKRECRAAHQARDAACKAEQRRGRKACPKRR